MNQGVRTAGVFAPWHPEREEAAARALEREGITVTEHDPQTVVAVGGDGTFLKALDRFPVPVLPVNAGHLGFLATCDEADLPSAARHLASGGFLLEELPLLSARMDDGREFHAVNDVCLHRCIQSGLLHMSIRVNGQEAALLTGDGVLVSTPAGSTAYSLSCGGPILHPELGAMVITPVCPHLLSLRPIVIPMTAEVHITVLGPDDQAQVSPDGRKTDGILTRGAGARITRSPENRHLIRFHDGEGYYSRLGRKLGWSFRG